MSNLIKFLIFLSSVAAIFALGRMVRTGELFDVTLADVKVWWMIVVFIATFVALATEIKPPAIVMFFSASTLVVTGILTPGEFLQGFSNEIVMTIAMLCIIVRAMEINGLLDAIGKRVLSTSQNEKVQLMSVCFPVAVGSAFLNNTPIVLLMTPLVRKWAIRLKRSPSKYLLPLSYAAILGGACTLIGTSTNLIIHALLLRIHPDLGFSFFELGWVGLPCAVVGFIYIIFIASRLLPIRIEPSTAVGDDVKSFTAEFVVGPECPIANKTIQECSRKYLRGELLIQVIRNRQVIDSPSEDFVLFIDDTLVFLGDIHQIGELHAIPDLISAADPKFKLDVNSSHFAEVVITSTSLLIGRTLRETHFRNRYGASVVAIYREGWRVLGDVRDVEIKSGDTLMLLSGEPLEERGYLRRDFYYIRHHEKLQVFHFVRSMIVLSTLIGIVTAVSMGIPIVVASVCGALGLIVSGTVSLREAQNSIMWSVLLLISCSFALGSALEATGVAAIFAKFLLEVFGSDPRVIIGVVVFVTSVCTELMTNNAAALIIFPIAHQFAVLAGYESYAAIKAIGVAVALGASCSYAIPTGYQTNVIVFGPGGYKFIDFLKIGIPMNIIIWAMITWLVPIFWPLG